ncbi:AAA family ATPase [Neptuniibacter sp.]|uniref:AAA family ATPase n=1 Tax=Neptuniibacter sp. TaxID=1962643 RepID=UPI003B59E0A0
MIIQVAKVRASGIRSVLAVKQDGSIENRAKTLTVRFPKDCTDAASPGSVWRIEGAIEQRCFAINHVKIVKEEHIKAQKAEFIKPSGELLALWISYNIDGIGITIARRLVRALPNLHEIIREADSKTLSAIKGLNETRAKAIIENWPSESLYDVLEFLQTSSLPLGLARRLVSVYEDQALEKLKVDPFILAAFGVSFSNILDFIERLELKIESDRILAAIAEHVATRYCHRTGSTVIPVEHLIEQSTAITEDLKLSTETLVSDAISHGVFLETSKGLQTLGAAIQENTVAHFIKKAALRPAGQGSLLATWEKNLTDESIEQALVNFESTLPFRMNEEQRDAIKGAVKSPVSIISGGAGTGKTTILKALFALYDQLADGIFEYQVALSGRAAQRMSESTERPAITIAKMIYDHVGEKKNQIPDHILLVVDEASMVDLLSAYKLVGILPEATRIVLVGDDAQLLPVGGGLVFHAAINSTLPVFHLKQVKRQSDQSGIHRLATAIRNNDFKLDLLNCESKDCTYSDNTSPEHIVNVWEKAGGAESCVILTPSRKGNLGVDSLNQLIQSHLDSFENRPSLHYQDDLRGWITWITSSGAELRLEDQIMITANDYETGIRNGDLGTITEVLSEPEDDVIGRMNVNGEIIDITATLLESVELGYAITIHKSQGSQWPTCIFMLPSYVEHMLDQTLLYTAVTRPAEKLVILGKSELVSKALAKGKSSDHRVTNLENLLIN